MQTPPLLQAETTVKNGKADKCGQGVIEKINQEGVERSQPVSLTLFSATEVRLRRVRSEQTVEGRLSSPVVVSGKPERSDVLLVAV